MKRFLVIAMLLTSTLRAEIIDRIAAIVNNRVITLSDIRRERQIRAFLEAREAKDDKTILKELIDAQLIDEQIAQFPGIAVREEDVAAELRRHPATTAIPDDLLREAVRRRLRTNEFFEVRFRQSIRPSDEEVRQYYEKTFLPEAARRGLNPVPTLEEMSAGIFRNVQEEKVVHEVETWLEAIRRRSDVEVFD
jgi:peptidyl-prolyl cis-trans isomerase SurA